MVESREDVPPRNVESTVDCGGVVHLSSVRCVPPPPPYPPPIKVNLKHSDTLERVIARTEAGARRGGRCWGIRNEGAGYWVLR